MKKKKKKIKVEATPVVEAVPEKLNWNKVIHSLLYFVTATLSFTCVLFSIVQGYLMHQKGDFFSAVSFYLIAGILAVIASSSLEGKNPFRD